MSAAAEALGGGAAEDPAAPLTAAQLKRKPTSVAEWDALRMAERPWIAARLGEARALAATPALPSSRADEVDARIGAEGFAVRAFERARGPFGQGATADGQPRALATTFGALLGEQAHQ